MIRGVISIRTLLVVVALLLATANDQQVSIPALAHLDGHDSISFALREENDSGQSGQATLVDRGGDTEVFLRLSSTGTTRSLEAHIHSGQCGPTLLLDVEYGLSNFTGGLSITLLEGVNLESLLSGTFAVNTHDSRDPSISTSCGNIRHGDVGDAAIEGGSVSFVLNEESNSGQSGQATLNALGADTEVILNLTYTGSSRASAAHIHGGQCGRTILSDVEHELSDFVDGTSTTLLRGVSLESLGNGNFAINTHDAQDPSISTSCGNIRHEDYRGAILEDSSISFDLNAESNSGQSGRATLNGRGADTEVTLNIISGGPSRPLAAHIHVGQCGRTLLSDVAYELSDFIGGLSITLLEGVDLESLINGSFAITSHDAQDPSISTSCGNILREAEGLLYFALAPDNKFDAINGTDPFLIMEGNGKFTPTRVEGEGTYVLLNLAPPGGSNPSLSSGTWTATNIVGYTEQSSAYQIATPGVLDFLVDFTPDQGPAIKGATLRIICDVRDSGSRGNNPGPRSPLSGEFFLTVPQSAFPSGPLVGMHPGAPTSPNCE